MSKGFVRKTLTGWSPADDNTREIHKRQKPGQMYRMDIVQPRNYKHHCLFMALMDLTFQNQEKYTDFRMFRRAVALEAGHVDTVITLDGEVHLVPLSYSYDELPDEHEFTKEFGAAMNVCSKILGGLGLGELQGEVSKYAVEHYGLAA